MSDFKICTMPRTPENMAALNPAYSPKAAPLVSMSAAQANPQGNLYAVLDGENVLMTFIIDYVKRSCGTIEAEICAAAGELKGCDLVLSIWPAIKQIAKDQGASSVMFETKRRGLIAKAAAVGFKESSRILRIAI